MLCKVSEFVTGHYSGQSGLLMIHKFAIIGTLKVNITNEKNVLNKLKCIANATYIA